MFSYNSASAGTNGWQYGGNAPQSTFSAQPQMYSSPSTFGYANAPVYQHLPVQHVPSIPHRDLEIEHCNLVVRQEPEEALVTLAGKEKSRKPIDPPPILQLQVSASADQSQLYLNSPNLMCIAYLVGEHDEEPIRVSSEGGKGPVLCGTLVSSIHKLKDERNSDGGYFIYGDISVRQTGRYRLKFVLFDLSKKQSQEGTPKAFNLASVVSRPFTVYQQKDFKGLGESTYLSRAFSDQGVRLRLRKEARADRSHKKRSAPDALSDDLKRSPDSRTNGLGGSSYKRQRMASDSYTHHTESNAGSESYSTHGGAVRTPQGQSFSDPSAFHYTGDYHHGDFQQAENGQARDGYYLNGQLAANSNAFDGVGSLLGSHYAAAGRSDYPDPEVSTAERTLSYHSTSASDAFAFASTALSVRDDINGTGASLDPLAVTAAGLPSTHFAADGESAFHGAADFATDASQLTADFAGFPRIPTPLSRHDERVRGHLEALRP